MVDTQEVWKGFHWSFFVNVQALIICLRRFEFSLLLGDIVTAKIELETATDLMLASGASMQLAGSFSKQEYESHIRPKMSPPYVQSDNFSGLMSWEHATLMQLWKRLSPTFKNMPDELESTHEKFVIAYFELVADHKAVCKKFGGDEAGSLRFEKGTAVDTLDKFGQIRTKHINPNGKSISRCPFHNLHQNS
ncbi:siderophore biosynthesis protein [Plectonema cf. radiosum LEGE 06105]|uniref:Siderophore biosynthesis protein n=1 Tax=Plectonema cf. radiosum LEGE 06105 TaxID=945769 RepID=A0A8J7F8H2_9CYAN|nr:siderophore biosynthesis protein [Plectonema radiosum]MBE9216527.1 siderophore biosynthesis protein [Plectonema cf. radiosum LEGE 06105]